MVERHAAFIFRVQTVVVQIGQVDLGSRHLYPVQTVDQLLDKGLGGAAVKGDVVDRQMEDHAAVCNGIQGRTDGDRGVEIERLGVAVDDGDDFLARSRRLFLDLRRFVGQDAHRKSVFLAVIGGERLVRFEYRRQGIFDGFHVRALDDGGDIEVVDRRVLVELLL